MGAVPGGTATLADIITGMQGQKAAAETAALEPDLVRARTAGLQAENEQRKMQTLAMQRQLRDNDIMQRAFVNVPNGDPAGISQYLIRNGMSAPGYLSYQSHLMDMQGKMATLTEAQHKNEDWTQKQTGAALAASLGKPEMWPGTVQRLQQLHPGSQIPSEYPGDESVNAMIGMNNFAGTMLAQRKTVAETAQAEARTEEAKATTAKTKQATTATERSLGLQELSGVTDAASYAAWKQKHPTLQAPAVYDANWVKTAVRSAVPVEKQPEYDINARKAEMGIMGNNDFETFFLPAYAQSLGKSIPQLSPQERMDAFGKYSEVKTDPAMRASLLASRTLSQQLQQIQISQQPTPEQAAAFAQDLVAHRMAPSQISLFGGFGASGQNFKRMVLAEAKKLDPNYNFEESEAEYQLSKNPSFQQTVRYMDYVGVSMNNVISAADKLANGNIRSINAVKNWTADQLNGVDIARFNTARIEVADAIAKILQGGGTGSGTSDMKLKQAQDLIRSTDSPQVVRTVAHEISSLIGNRRRTLTKGTYMEQAGQPAVQAPQTGGGADLTKLSTDELLRRLSGGK